MSIIDTLKSSKLFEGFEAHHLKKIADLCRGGSFREGTMVFKDGDEAAELYVLTEGKVALEINVRPVADRPAMPCAMEVVSKGEAFGWSALVEPHTYTLSARCMTNCTVLAIKADMLQKLIADDPSLGYELMKRLARLIRLRLTRTRLRLVSGFGLFITSKDLGGSE